MKNATIMLDRDSSPAQEGRFGIRTNAAYRQITLSLVYNNSWVTAEMPVSRYWCREGHLVKIVPVLQKKSCDNHQMWKSTVLEKCLFLLRLLCSLTSLIFHAVQLWIKFSVNVPVNFWFKYCNMELGPKNFVRFCDLRVSVIACKL